jgi:uncharacterized protein (TIGR03066 family)
MNTLCVIAASIALLGLTTAAQADGPKKDDTVTKLLGKWEVTKATDETLVGAIVTFEKGGKVSLVKKVDGKETKLDGTYKVEKDKLVSDIAGNTDTNTIKKLTAAALELENEESSATTVLKKTK